MSNLKQFKKDLKACKHVYGLVNMTKDDSHYLELKKTDVLFQIENWPESITVEYNVDFPYMYIG